MLVATPTVYSEVAHSMTSETFRKKGRLVVNTLTNLRVFKQ